jgi:integrase
VAALTEKAGPPQQPLLSEVLPDFLAHARDQLDPQEQGNRYVQYAIPRAFAAFIDVIGDRRLDAYRPADLERFGAILARVPANWQKLPRLKAMRLAEAADFNDKLAQPYPTLAGPSILRGYLGPVKHGLDWLCANRPPESPLRSPFADVKARAPRKARSAIARNSLKVEQVNAVLREAARRSNAAERWLPLLAIVTGMRLAELVDLQASDIDKVGAVWVLDLRKDIEINGRRIKRRIKSEAGRRLVVLHSVLEEAGFIAWARGRSGFLFDGLHRAKNPASAASKRLARLIKKAGVKSPDLVFHSTRHTAKQWLDDGGIKERDVRLQVGHAMSGVHGRYGKKTLEPEDLPQFKCVLLPKGLDLSGYTKNG